MHRLIFRKQAIKVLRKMPSRLARLIRNDLDDLAKNPDGHDLGVSPLRGRPGFRLRVGGIRIIFEHNEAAGVIDVLRIAPREQVYKV